MRLLLDEHISPTLVRRLADLGVYAQSVPHVGLSGSSDRVMWSYALKHDFTVVTTNAEDFIELLDVELHPGLIVLRESGLTREEQWKRLEPVVRHVLRSGDQDYLLNKLIEIWSDKRFETREIPPAKVVIKNYSAVDCFRFSLKNFCKISEHSFSSTPAFTSIL